MSLRLRLTGGAVNLRDPPLDIFVFQFSTDVFSVRLIRLLCSLWKKAFLVLYDEFFNVLNG